MTRLSNLAKSLAGKSGGETEALWLPLWVHARDTAEVMVRLVNGRLSEATRRAIGLKEDELIRVARFLGTVHDLGKATVLFQYNVTRRIPDVRERLRSVGITFPIAFQNPDKSHHALAGEAIARWLGCPRGEASIIGAHHGRPQEGGEIRAQLRSWQRNYWAKGQEDLWRQVWQEFWQWALKGAGYATKEELPSLNVPAELLLTGLLTMADWIASNTRYFPLLSVDEWGDESLWPRRVERAWEALNLTPPWESFCQAMDVATFTERFGFAPNALQRAVMRVVDEAATPGLLIVEAQMGGGKTEAAFSAAEVLASRFQCGGLFFGLPTQATANGLFGRLMAWAKTQAEGERLSIRLEHAAAETNEDYQAFLEGTTRTEEDNPEAGLEVHPWFQGRKVALLADFVVGTVDQLLMAALKQKHVMLRQFGLVGKVVVVDECHAYDAYMSQYLDCVLEWLGRWRVPVILLSATLPAKRRAELVRAYLGDKKLSGDWETCHSYPLLTWVSEGTVQQTVVRESVASQLGQVRVERGMVADLPKRLREALREGGCAGIIVNTVRRAQEIAEVLREAFPEAEQWKVVLFHAQFVLADRANLERDLVARVGKASVPESRNRLIVVGTQVLEQSLDIDFDFLVTELCPMDLLLQRIGRLHRHPRLRPEPLRDATCLVLDTGAEAFDPGSVAVYGEWLLWRTRLLLPESLTLPDDLPRLVHAVYDWIPDDALSQVRNEDAYERYRNRQKNLRERAKIFVLQGPEDSLDDTLDGLLVGNAISADAIARAAVRDGDPSIDVLVMSRHTDGSMHFLPWQKGGRAVATDVPPSREDCQAILRQAIRLPAYFSKRFRIEAVIRELEERNQALAIWQEAPLLKGELVLTLDEHLTTGLAGAKLQYSQVTGLRYCDEESDEGS